MLTPLDIQNKEFNKSFRGYKEVEVDGFLDDVISDYELIYKENLELKNKISMLNDQINHYSSIENTLQKTLVVAQTTAEEIILTSRKKSDMIIDEADSRAEKIIVSARDQVIDSKKEYETIKKEILMFKNKYKTLLNSQLETMEYYSEEGNVFNMLEESENKGKQEEAHIPQAIIEELQESKEEVGVAKDETEELVKEENTELHGNLYQCEKQQPIRLYEENKKSIEEPSFEYTEKLHHGDAELPQKTYNIYGENSNNKEFEINYRRKPLID